MRRISLLSLVLFLVVVAAASPALASGRTLAVGALGDDVAQLQATLARLGFDPGPIDGDFGYRTEQAVKQFQIRNQLAADGIVGPATWRALGEDGSDPSRSGASFVRYLVRPGDTMFLIAQRYGISLAELIGANALARPDLIYPGQALAIPRSFPSAPPLEPEPAPTPELPQDGQGFDVVGYFVEYYSGDNLSWNSFTTYKDAISTAAAFSYQINWDGSVSGQAYSRLLREAKAAGKSVLALVHNISGGGNFDRNLIHAILSNPALRSTAVANICRTVRSGGYAGVNIDFEDVPTYDRQLYTAFVRELAAELQPGGYQVTLSVPAKTWDDPQNAWSGAFDYRALGEIADAIMIMTYDEHWSGGSAGPVASLGWVKQVVDYAASVIPPEKIRLGIAAYGYDWPLGGYGGRAVTATEAVALAQRYGATIEWDHASQCPYFTYWPGNYARRVWFENAASTAAKLDLCRQYNLGGVAIWRLGFEDPGLWKVIKDKFDLR
ncbi:MAG: LysM peptidoglycan-binding domain-containing protein [Firmicutes bacterium]|nr:LysM peptidoglycan-binding domain-containing protein [Bacillota bacterium]